MPIKPKNRVIGASTITTITEELQTPTKLLTSNFNETSVSLTPNCLESSSVPSMTIDLSDKVQSLSSFNDDKPDIIVTHIDAVEDDRIIGLTPSPPYDKNDVKRDDDDNDDDDDDNVGCDDENGIFVCTICNKKMITLLQLKRHLNDIHSPQEKSKVNGGQFINNKTLVPNTINPNDELRSWLKKGNNVKSKIQQNLPKNFAKLDIFDKCNNYGITDFSYDNSSSSLNTVTPKIQVTIKHWKRPTGFDICSELGCKKRLNIKIGMINCRKCGDLFCHDHTVFRVKLNAEANIDHNGIWCRCCESCFKERSGYYDTAKFVDLTDNFVNRRQQKLNENQLYINKLEKRILKLIQKLNNIDAGHQTSKFQNNFLRFRINSKKKEIEKQLVQWEDENFVLNCFLCLKDFSFSLRKHHCRLCGRVICGSEDSGCSREVPINMLTSMLIDVPKVNDEHSIRICLGCKNVLFVKRNFIKDLKKPLTPLLSKFDSQQNIKKTILLLLPKFQNLIDRLQNDKDLRNITIINNASTIRKRLLESFATFEKLTKKIVTTEPEFEDEKRLQLAIQLESASFIQRNTTLLKQLPHILKHIEQQSIQSTPKSLKNSEIQQIKSNREMLMVLNEQRFIIQKMLETCKKQRRFDEIPTLTENLNELTRKIEELKLELGNEGF